MFCTTTTEFARRPGVTDADIAAASAQFAANVEYVLGADELGVDYDAERVYVEIEAHIDDSPAAATIGDGIVALAHALAGEVVTIRQRIEDDKAICGGATVIVAGPHEAVRAWLRADHAAQLARLQADHTCRLRELDRLPAGPVAIELPADD